MSSFLESRLHWSIFLIPSTFLVVYTLPSFADVNFPSDAGISETHNCPIPLSISSELPIRRPIDPGCRNQGQNRLKPIPKRDSTALLVKKIQVIDSKFSNSGELNAITSKVEGLTVTLADLRKVADEITQLYFDKGYITSRATIDASEIKDGIVPIRVIEGNALQIKVDPSSQEFSKPSSPPTNVNKPNPPSTDSTKPSSPPINVNKPNPPSTDSTKPSSSPANVNKPNPPSTDSTKPSSSPANSTLPSDKILVRKIKLKDSSFANSSDLRKSFEAIFKDKEERLLSLTEITKIADNITAWYFEKGFLNSHALSPTFSDVKDGVLSIQVLEGIAEKIEVKFESSRKNLNPEYVRSRFSLATAKPLSYYKVEEQARLLSLDPLFKKVEGTIRLNSQNKYGPSTVIVKVTEANPIEVNLSLDNSSPPTVGSERLGINAVDYNLTGRGDQLAISYYFTIKGGGANIYDFKYQLPLNPMNGTLQFRVSLNDIRIIQPPFNVLDVHGDSQLYEFTYRQPIVRNLKEEAALSLGFAVQDGQTFTFAELHLLVLV